MNVKVKVGYMQTVFYSKEIEMEYSEYLRLGEVLNGSGKEYRDAQADLFQRCNFDRLTDLSDSSDPELEDFEQVTAE